jgi:D-alanyl-D-alanine carboxypeptidase
MALAEEKFESLVQNLLSKKNIKHAIAGVASSDDSIQLISAAGVADENGTPMQKNTPFFIASITKLFISVTVMKIYEDGKLNLEDSISKHLPENLVHSIHKLNGFDYSNRITVQHLLSHSSGLPDWIEDRPKGGKSFVEKIESEEDRIITVEEVVSIVRENLSPHFPPQSLNSRRIKIRYSDTNYHLLMAIIENVTGKQLSEVFNDMIYSSLELNNTFHPEQIISKNILKPALIWNESKPLNKPFLIQSFRDLYSTADDLLKFIKALVQGKIFKQQLTFKMMQHWNRFGLPKDKASLRQPGWPIEYGFGMMRFKLPRWLTPIKAIPELIGHTGSTGSWLFYCPEKDLYFCGTVDQVTAGAVPFRFVPKLLHTIG